MSAHLTDRQLAAFRDGTLPPADILSLDAHLATCAECRARADVASAAMQLVSDLTVDPDSELHPDDEQLAEFVDGRSPTARDVDRHLAECAECAATVDDLRVLRAAIGKPRMPTARWAAGAAAVTILGASLWMWRTSHSRPDGAGSAIVAGLDRFSEAEQHTIRSALDSGTLPAARNLDGVRRQEGRLMGRADARPPFSPLSPVATAVDVTLPEFRWSPLDGARGYVVTVVDSALLPVAESPVVRETQWRPSTPLARGRTYAWQVRAMLPTGSQTAPAPPEPEARFFVLSEAEAADVASLRRRAGDSGLVGVLLAQYGLMDEAEAMLAKAAAERPSDAPLSKLEHAARQARTATDRR